MNDSQQNLPDDTEPQDLLDRITQQLREQSIPPLPERCQHWTPEPALAERKRLRGSRLVACWIAAALLLMLGAVYWNWPVESPEIIVEDDSKTELKTADNVQTVAIVLTERLDEMRHGLDELDGEIAELKRQAALLDARRKAESMLNAMANSKGSVRTAADES